MKTFRGRARGGCGLSEEGMVFGEISYRAPQRAKRPDRDRRWACLAYEVPAAGDLPVFLDRATADAIERHALRDTSVELGGILLGKECVDDVTGEPFVWVTRSLEAKHYQNTQASFTYTHDSWEEITRERDRLHPDLDIVGWYHTHPDFGIFLSSHDLFIQHHFFGQPLQVAYVVDPVRQTRGFFRWNGGRMEQVDGFYLTAERGERLALVRLVNDLENVDTSAQPDGVSGGLSPRLEAELIAMLTRPAAPHYQAQSPFDRAQLATFFAVAGVACGALGLAAVLWLNQLHARLLEQSAALGRLEGAVVDQSDRQRLALDALAAGAPGQSADALVEQYAKASRVRAEVEKRLGEREATLNVLADKVKTQSDEIVKLSRERDKLKEAAAAAGDTAKLREDLAALNAEAEKKTQALAELSAVAETVEGKNAASLLKTYQTTWYAAVGGWAVSTVLALGLTAGYFYVRPALDAEANPNPRDQTPPHAIV